MQTIEARVPGPALAPSHAAYPRRPSLTELGLDLLDVTPWERASALGLPFALAAGCFAFGWAGLWVPAIACVVGQSFYTYASVSHDLVHRTLRLPRGVNEALLCAIELISLRSGHAFRATHLHHHAAFPEDDDIEGRSAAQTWWRALLDGFTAQPRQWWWALARSRGATRRWIALEGVGVGVLIAGCVLSSRWTMAPAVYAALNIAGSWVFPFMTSHLPHVPAGDHPLTQTRLFRGRIIDVLSRHHLYHLEHHLYPQVPHHRWPELARRLDAYFARCGLRPIVLWR